MASCDLRVMLDREAGWTLSLKGQQGLWSPKHPRASVGAGSISVAATPGAGLPGQRRSPHTCLTAALGPLAGGPFLAPWAAPPLAHFSNKSTRPKYWCLGTKNWAAITHSGFFFAFLSCKHFHFSRADKAAFPRNWEEGLWPRLGTEYFVRARNHQLLLHLGSRGLQPV